MRKLKNKRNLLIILCVILFFMAVGFAAFNQKLEISDKSEVTTNWHIYISDASVKETNGTASGTASITDGVSVTLSPNFKNRGDSITYNITVTNGGDVNAFLETITLGDYDTSTITVSIDGIEEGESLIQGESKTFTVFIKYNENAGTLTQKTGDISLDLKYIQGAIISGVNAATVGGNNIALTASGDGLYPDPVETGRYVYRGVEPRNYIWLDLNGDTSKTDDEIYRIVAVEADSTIKVIAQNSLGNNIWDKSGSRVASGYCSYTYCNAWGSSTTTLDTSGNNVTVMPREAGSSTTYALPSNEASLNTYLNTTFLESINTDLQNKIALHTYNVGPLTRKSGQTLATDISQESAYKWSGKIGLISATDYVRASTNSACTSAYEYYATSNCYNNSDTHNYLFHSVDAWTMSTYSYSSSRYVWLMFSDGHLSYNFTYTGKDGVFPSFYLTSNIKLSGKGTSGQPYEIVS